MCWTRLFLDDLSTLPIHSLTSGRLSEIPFVATGMAKRLKSILVGGIFFYLFIKNTRVWLAQESVHVSLTGLIKETLNKKTLRKKCRVRVRVIGCKLKTNTSNNL